MQIQTTNTQPARANTNSSIAERFMAKVGPEPKCTKLDRYIADAGDSLYPPSLFGALGAAVIGGGASYLAGLSAWGIAAGTMAAGASVGIVGYALETRAYNKRSQHGNWANSMGFARSVLESKGLQDGELKVFKDADVVVTEDKMLVRFNKSGRYLLIDNHGKKDEVSWDSEREVRSTPLAGEGLWRMNKDIKLTSYQEYHSWGFKDPYNGSPPSKGTQITLSDNGKLSVYDRGGSVTFPNGRYHYDLNAIEE